MPRIIDDILQMAAELPAEKAASAIAAILAKIEVHPLYGRGATKVMYDGEVAMFTDDGRMAALPHPVQEPQADGEDMMF